jgi:hypothetical protein
MAYHLQAQNVCCSLLAFKFITLLVRRVGD